MMWRDKNVQKLFFHVRYTHHSQLWKVAIVLIRRNSSHSNINHDQGWRINQLIQTDGWQGSSSQNVPKWAFWHFAKCWEICRNPSKPVPWFLRKNQGHRHACVLPWLKWDWPADKRTEDLWVGALKMMHKIHFGILAYDYTLRVFLFCVVNHHSIFFVG